MALTASNPFPLGSKAPNFVLPDTISDKNLSLDKLRASKGTVIMFLCNHCPYVKHINRELVKLVEEYKAKGLSFIGISSNDANRYPADAPDKMKESAKQEGYTFPYLYDETQEVAKAYDAACTPEFYLFDGDLKLVYHGQMDDSRPGNHTVNDGRDLRKALNQLLAGERIFEDQKPGIGCGIKWK